LVVEVVGCGCVVVVMESVAEAHIVVLANVVVATDSVSAAVTGYDGVKTLEAASDVSVETYVSLGEVTSAIGFSCTIIKHSGNLFTALIYRVP